MGKVIGAEVDLETLRRLDEVADRWPRLRPTRSQLLRLAVEEFLARQDVTAPPSSKVLVQGQDGAPLAWSGE